VTDETVRTELEDALGTLLAEAQPVPAAAAAA